MAKDSALKDKQQDKPVVSRSVKPIEERSKKGRWITWAIFFGSILFAYFFWSRY